jgi:hypothetical protein
MSRHRRFDRSPQALGAHGFRKSFEGSGVLPVSCWCERSIVAVSQTDVSTGKTASCGHPACHPPIGARGPESISR